VSRSVAGGLIAGVAALTASRIMSTVANNGDVRYSNCRNCWLVRSFVG
jgi:hypothetical protein